MVPIKIYTDGGCSGNQNQENLGGWGAILIYGTHQKELFGSEKNTTNNRMEMVALISALAAIKKPKQTIEVYSDSSYLMDCFRKAWYKKWLANGWQTANKKPVENRDLWELLLPYLEMHSLSFFRVKGHVNLGSPATDKDALFKKFLEWNGQSFSFADFVLATEMNNHADSLANKGIDSLRQST